MPRTIRLFVKWILPSTFWRALRCRTSSTKVIRLWIQLGINHQHIKQESPPAWTQEAYRPPRNKYMLCCSCWGGTPGGRPPCLTLGGHPPAGGVPWAGTPLPRVPWAGAPLVGGEPRWVPPLIWMGYPPTISWTGYTPPPSAGRGTPPPSAGWGTTPHHQLDGVPPPGVDRHTKWKYYLLSYYVRGR